MKLVVDSTLVAETVIDRQAVLSMIEAVSKSVQIFVSFGDVSPAVCFETIHVVPVAFDQLVKSQSGLLERDLVFALTDRLDVALGVAGLEGVIPVILSNGPCSLLTINHADNVLFIRSCDDLVSLLTEAHALPLLDLFGIDFQNHIRQNDDRLNGLKQRILTAGGLCIYGAGTIGRQALTAARSMALPVKAFVDMNPALQGRIVNDVPVISPEDLKSGTDFVVPALGRHLAEVRLTLGSCGVEILSLSELYYMARTPSEPEKAYWHDLETNRLQYLALYLTLKDQVSRSVLAAAIRHRLSLDPRSLESVCERGHPQWFDPEFIPKNPGAIFVDGGAFDGDTVEGFIKAYGFHYGSIYAFELDPAIAERGDMRLAAHERIYYNNIGLSDRSGHVHIRSTGGTDGGIGVVHSPHVQSLDRETSLGDAGTSVAIGCLDQLIDEHIDYLKLDVEGEEARVLDGSARHIILDHPIIGIAVYHHADDLWSLPKKILNKRDDYQIFMRHYTDLAYETVIYAIPISS